VKHQQEQLNYQTKMCWWQTVNLAKKINATKNVNLQQPHCA